MLFLQTVAAYLSISNIGSLPVFANVSLLGAYSVELPQVLLTYKLPITLTLFVFLTLVTILLFVMERMHRVRGAEKLSADSEQLLKAGYTSYIE